jgi:O-antigen ligase
MDRIIVGAGVLILSGAFLPIIFADRKFNYIEGSPGYEMTLGAIYVVTAAYSVIHFRQIAAVLSRSKPLVFVTAVALLSPLWAENPNLAIRRSFALLGTTLIGALLASRFHSSERLNLLSVIFRVLAVSCILFAIVLPQYGITTDRLLHLGDWTGVFGNKNRLGAYVALAFLVDWYRPIGARSRLLWCGLYILLLVESRSASPLAALLATWVMIKLIHTMRTRHRLSLRAIGLAIGSAIGICVGAGLGTGVLQAVLGRSADLTGRTELWQELIPTLLHHPLLGYGYGSFWAGASADYFALQRNLSWVPMYAHNGYLEVLVSLGLAGGAGAFWFLARGTIHATLLAETSDLREDLFPFAFLVYFLIHNIVECTIVYLNSLEWALCVATVLAVLPERLEKWEAIAFDESESELAIPEEYA